MADTTASADLLASGPLRAWVRAVRPRQWAKNVLVFAAPAAAGALLRPGVPLATLVAFVAFTLVASAVYLINDVMDVERDRAHPTKSRRPIAAGIIPVRSAATVAGVLAVAGLALAWSLGYAALTLLAVYLGSTLAYSSWLKHEAVVDIIIVASGFVLRAAMGAAAADVPVSSWFLIVTSFGALMVVSGKRYAETMNLEGDGSHHRPSLAAYTPEFLRLVMGVSVGMTIITYCLWAFEGAPSGTSKLLSALSIVPFLGAMLRYVLVVMNGRGGEPEEIFLSDRGLQVWGLIWLAAFVAGVTLG